MAKGIALKSKTNVKPAKGENPNEYYQINSIKNL
jgi:alpha-L-fucosidase 2